MKPFFFPAVFLLLSIVPHSAAQNIDTPLRMRDAVERALARDYEVQRQQARIEQIHARNAQLTVLPNPVAAYMREDLSAGDRRIHEWTATVDFPLLSLLHRGKRLSAAESALRAAQAQGNWTRTDLRFEVRKAFLDVWEARRVHEALGAIGDALQVLQRAAALRAQEGDISAYEYQRLRTALAGFRWRSTEAGQSLRKTEAGLAYLLGISPEAVSRTTLLLPDLPHADDIETETLLRTGLQHRADAIALRLECEALERQRAWQRLRWLDDLRIGGGYKEQSDLFAGPVLTLSLPLPVFDRNQGTVDETIATRALLSAELQALEQHIEIEIRRAATDYEHLLAHYETISLPDNDALTQFLTSATSAYEEGEFSLVEYLDAISAWIEGQTMHARMQSGLLRAVYTLFHAVGNDVFTITE
ncbi:MAG: TolC family protein [Bacteroidetes bacterium]|nr:TolC family protein [Bacteroidota bacterium]